MIYNNSVTFPHSVWIPVHLHYKVSCVCVGYLCACMDASSLELLCCFSTVLQRIIMHNPIELFDSLFVLLLE